MTDRNTVQPSLATLGASGWSIRAAVLPRNDNRKPLLIIGGDHPYSQWWGTNGRNGMAAMYLDRRITPYIAINADSSDGPGSTDMMTWAQCLALQNMGVEFVSHGYWHVDKWNRINTGIRVEYLGANGTATVQVQTAVPSTALVCTAGADSVTSTFSTDTTLAAVKATLEAAAGGGKWRVTIDPILTGSESSTNLLGMNAARDVKASANNTYFCAGGGLEVRYQGTNPPVAYSSVYMRRNSSANFTIFGDGVQVYNHTGSTGNMAALVTGINAIAGGEFVAKLCDNGRTETPTKPSYMIGDELETNLRQITHNDFGARPGVMECGLSQWYIIDRHMIYTAQLAAAEGITLKHFAQSGGNFYPWMTGHAAAGLYRGNTLWKANTPPVMKRNLIRDFVVHRALTNAEAGATFWPENIIAIVNAMCGDGTAQKSEPWVLVVLMHALRADGTSGYAITNTSTGYYDQYEADWLAFLNRVKTQVDAGLLKTGTLDQLSDMDRSDKPSNLFFNPAFENGGASRMPAAGGSDGGFVVPGWGLIRPATMSTMSFAGGVLSMVNSSATATEFINQEVDLEPGKTYEARVYLDVTAYTAGAGVQWSLQAMHGRVKGIIAPATNWKITGAQIFQSGEVVMRFTVPKYENTVPAIAASMVGETWDLSVNKNIKININGVLSIDNLDCSVTAAAAGRAATARAIDVATDINNAIKAAGTYGAEYFAVATAVAGRVVITAPLVGTDQLTTVSILPATANSATGVIFGATTVDGRGQFANPPTSENFVYRLALRSALQASFAISRPRLYEAEYN